MLRMAALSLLVAAAAAAAGCPADLPSGCGCKEKEARLSISCVSVPLAAILPHLDNRTMDSLSLVNCSLPSLEGKLALKGLRTLELAHCGIESVDPESLSAVAASLEELSLPDNRLKEVPPMGRMPRLARINLNRNLISDLPSGTFSFAPLLSQLRLEENRVCSLGPQSLDETKKTLALLDLSGNCLSSLVNVNGFRGASALAYLDLSSNKLTELAPLSLMNLPSLIEARLSDNLISRLQPLSITGTPELRYLYLQNNLLDTLTALPALSKLEVLDARDNRLTKMPLLSDSPSLRQLRLDSNAISSIESRALTHNTKLQLLSIQDNSLSSLFPSSLDGLSQLAVLLLANNNLTRIEGASLSPLKSVQQLNLRNNSISSLEGSALSPLKQLTTLDLGLNELERLDKGIFEPFPKLFWVDLSGNRLASFEKGTFTKRISNLLLDGNPLNCDESLDWFVQWLVVNRVRTFLPNQADVVCRAPPAYEGVKLRDLMIKKANETMKVIGLQQEKPKAGQALVTNLLPGMSLMNNLLPAGQQAAQAAAGLGQIPGLGALLNGMPSLRNLPLSGGGVSPLPAGSVRSMNSAVEQFAAPLVRFATGGQPQAADFEQLMQSIPKMIEAAPGGAAAAIDVSKIPPNVMAHVLRGGQVPGIARETLDRIVSGHLRKMAEVAAAVGRGEHPADVEKYLPPLERLPSELISSVMGGDSLEGLSEQQMQNIKDYYISTLPLSPPSSPSASSPSTLLSPPLPSAALPSFPLTSQSLEMMRLLPPGYDISRIPSQIMEAISKGEMPDLRLLPADLQEHLKTKTDKMLNMFQSGGGGAETKTQDLREVIDKLPSWDRPLETMTYSPYDLNAVQIDEKKEREEAARMRSYRLMAGGVIGLLAMISSIFVVSMCIAQRRKITEGGVERSGGASTIDAVRANSTPSLLSHPNPRDSSSPSQTGIFHRRSPNYTN